MSESVADSQELIEDFIAEAMDSLATLPALLEAHCADGRDAGGINAVFRAVHSIKGNAGFFGFAAIKSFAHTLENTLDRIRQRELSLTPAICQCLIEGVDQLTEMVTETGSGEPERELPARCSEILEKISQLAPAESAATPEQILLESIQALSREIREFGSHEEHPQLQQIVQIVEQFDRATGQVPQTRCPTPAELIELPWKYGETSLDELVAPLLKLFIATAANEYGPLVRDEFICAAAALASWSAEQGLTTTAEGIRKAAADFHTIAHSPLDVDCSLLEIVWSSLWPALEPLAVGVQPAPADALNETEPAAESVTGELPAAESGTSGTRGGDAQKSRLIRIKEERLDEFLDHVSSLFITRELFKDLHGRMAATRQLRELTDELRQVTQTFGAQSTQLQQSLLALRMVSVAGLLSKVPRLARSLASQLGKQVEIHISGEETEIDKSLAEDLDAPLTHIVRNALDHGLDTPAERVARGAQEVGNLWLRAETTRTHFRLLIQDDGRGIDAVKIKNKAVERGIISATAAESLTEEDARQLIFEPGFSTAEKLSDVSGRGVGMDVVRTAIESHGGEVRVRSSVGVGTTFMLEIPLRKAVMVIDGLMLQHAGQQFVVPFEHLKEITELDPTKLRSVQGNRVAIVRGETYDAVSLSEVLQLSSESDHLPGPRPAVLVRSKQGDLCLIAERLLGHRQVVVNSLDEVLPDMEQIKGVAQLGGNRLALVLSIPDIVQRRLELRGANQVLSQTTMLVPA